MLVLFLFLSLNLSSSHASSVDQIVLDGRFDDWAEAESTSNMIDPVGDATGAFDVIDIRGLVKGTSLFLAVQLTEPFNLQAGPAEQGTLVLDVSLDDGRTLSIDFRDRSATFDNEPVSWQRLRFVALPTYASRRQELRIDFAGLGVTAGESINVSLRGSDEVTAVRLQLADDEDATKTRPSASLERAHGTSLRLAVMNVLWNGHADAGRGGQIGRLLQAAAPDVIALQEAMAREDLPNLDAGERADPDAAARQVQRVLERRFGGAWNAVADNRGAVVASRSEIKPVALGENVRGAVAIVDLNGDGPGPGDPLIVSVHLKCCGFAGSEEDQTRVAEVDALIAALKHLASEHAIVIAGDYNLVGSSRPLDALTTGPLGLIETLPLQLGEATAVTWRALSPSESFWPGRLDFISHAPSLGALQTFVIDTANLPADLLDANSLLRTDSLASDHLMIVADFALD